ncbi:hypothetical protein JCGZ_08278 [Jatropha curcas]|uniref:TF-B3 domain-containing protein n=1 Tax=Jatropha curcas TaxID=180498 RepID=A0A067KMS8_JATCU|nr:hypothetical protein JCGZ_08278 [Jatropha curcas]
MRENNDNNEGSGFLTFEDLNANNVAITRDMSKFDTLVLVAHVAYIKLEKEKKLQRLIKEKSLKRVADFPGKEKGFSTDFKRQRNFEGAHQKKEREGEGERETKTESKKRKITKKNSQPELPQRFKKKIIKMKGSDRKLLIEKRITKTDAGDGNSRFSMPKNQILCEFLNEDERDEIKKKLEVKIIEPCLDVSDMILKQWDYPKQNGNTTSSYVFRTHWNSLKKKNGLHQEDLIQVWSFRVENRLHFALVKVERGATKKGEEDEEYSPGSCISQYEDEDDKD